MLVVRAMSLVRHFDSRHLHNWLPGYLRDRLCRIGRSAPSAEPGHVLFALCDHFEPLWHGASAEEGRVRVDAWVSRYPLLAARFRDADGRPPRHSFFFPGEQYSPEYIERLGQLVVDGFGEIEVHLHHDGDTNEGLRRELRRFVGLLAGHGHLARDVDGRPRFAFIHGNWCLANARRDGRWCGVDEEVPLLFEAGCYADYTFPAAPDESQPGIVNRVYWPIGDLRRARCYEKGRTARVGETMHDRILMIEGPLALARRPGRLLPRIENGAVTAADPATPVRVGTWVEQGIHVHGRPEWVFVKVHTHGAPEKQAEALLGRGGEMLHRALTTRYNDGRRWKLHYLTAREMFNLAMAAMEGKSGDPNAYRDYVFPPPPATRR